MTECCIHCEEPIEDKGKAMAYANGPLAHAECFMRGIVGSVAHIQKCCSCFIPGSTCGDPEGMTKREAAQAAVKEWRRLNEP